MAGPTAREEVLGLLTELVAAEPVDGAAALLLVEGALAERDALISDLASEVARLLSILGNDSTNCGATTAVDRSSATGGRRSLGETDGDAGGTDGETGAHASGVGVDGGGGTSDAGADVGDGVGGDDANGGDRPANAFNGRKGTGRKRGGQPGHKGATMGMDAVLGVMARLRELGLEPACVDVGDPDLPFRVLYRIGVELVPTLTVVRHHGPVPAGESSPVAYDASVARLCAYLRNECDVSVGKVAGFVSDATAGAVAPSEGTVQAMMYRLADRCPESVKHILDRLLSSPVVYTDATYVFKDGKHAYLRNFSTKGEVLYVPLDSKSREALEGIDFLRGYHGILVHDHEVVLYHFGHGEHGECIIHVMRYCRKNAKDTDNGWTDDLAALLCEANDRKAEIMSGGGDSMPEAEYERVSERYDEVVAEGWRQNERTHHKWARKREATFLRRLAKYKDEHLLFLRDFRVEWSNNISERDLRSAKRHTKVTGGFREDRGMEAYAATLSVVRTMRRRGMRVWDGIRWLLENEGNVFEAEGLGVANPPNHA